MSASTDSTEETAFYSWQSDTPGKWNRNFIEDALAEAIKRLHADTSIDAAHRVIVDRDTQGVPGSPPIATTILAKIEKCAAFIADLTFVARSIPGVRAKGKKARLVPNPNVLIEYGYALRSRGTDRLIGVMNTAYGKDHLENLPFDLRYLRGPILYHLDESNKAEKKAIRDRLVSELVSRLKTILHARKAELATGPFPTRRFESSNMSNPATFFSPSGGEHGLITESRLGAAPPKVSVSENGVASLRLYPAQFVAGLRSALEAKERAEAGALRPMGFDLGGWSCSRNAMGAIVYAVPVDGKLLNFTQLFTSGEICGVDAYVVNFDHVVEARGDKPRRSIEAAEVERLFLATLQGFLTFSCNTLKYSGPWKVHADLYGVNGCAIATGRGLRGKCLTPQINWLGEIASAEETPADILKPFFEQMWTECGVRRE